jgi:hypothetical protein
MRQTWLKTKIGVLLNACSDLRFFTFQQLLNQFTFPSTSPPEDLKKFLKLFPTGEEPKELSAQNSRKI